MRATQTITSLAVEKKKQGKTSEKSKKLTTKQKLEAQAARWKAKSPSRKRLPSTFFDQHTVDASKQLLGKILCINGKQAYIVETEAYRGIEDNDGAAHAFSRDPSNKKNTAARKLQDDKDNNNNENDKNFIAFHAPGKIYVYQIYGMHHCMNIIVEPEGKPGCVLIRGVRDVEDGSLIDGPGRVCKYFNGMTKTSHNGVVLDQTDDQQLTATKEKCWIGEGVKIDKMKTTPRIGITKAADFPWRFLVQEPEEEEDQEQN